MSLGAAFTKFIPSFLVASLSKLLTNSDAYLASHLIYNVNALNILKKSSLPSSYLAALFLNVVYIILYILLYMFFYIWWYYGNS